MENNNDIAKPNKIFIHGQNEATFVCPECGHHKTTDISKFKEIKKAVRLKVKCPCNHVFSVLLERRQHFRIPTKLAGVYVITNSRHREPITIMNLSRTGIKFKLYSKFRTPVKVGDRLMVEFTLDNTQKTEIQKDVIIRNIDGLFIGVEFVQIKEIDPLFKYLFYTINK